jgi:molybdopterin-guanine dinucleotide biosynthesis protein A
MGGVPKGLELVGGVRVLDRVVSSLRSVTTDILLASNALEAPKWVDSVAVVRDESPNLGGVAGIHAALTGGRDILVVAWDMPFVASGLLGHLVQLAARNPDAWAVVPESEEGPEPFCAWYAARCRSATAAFLGTGGGQARDFVAALPLVVRVPVEDCARFGDPRDIFLSVNTPEDLARARTIAESAR